MYHSALLCRGVVVLWCCGVVVLWCCGVVCCVALTHTKLFRVDFGQNWNVIGQCAAVVHRRRVVTGSGGGGESGPIWNGENAVQTTQDLQEKKREWFSEPTVIPMPQLLMPQ